MPPLLEDLAKIGCVFFPNNQTPLNQKKKCFGFPFGRGTKIFSRQDNANIWVDKWIEGTLLKPSLEEQARREAPVARFCAKRVAPYPLSFL